MAASISLAIRTRQDWMPPVRDEGPGGGTIASSTAWSGLGIGATSALQLVRSMIFARLLMPEDFGVLGLANVFTQFILIFANFGFNQSVIYQKDLGKHDLSTCFWANVMVDGAAALICAVAALVTSIFTGDTTTAYVICLLAIQFVFTSLGSINSSLMRRQFMFRETAIVNFAGAVVTFLVAWALVGLAGWGVYGLVAGMNIGTLFMALMNFYYLPWLPSFTFSREAFGRHFRYGRWLLGVSLVTFANGSLDRVAIGTLLSKVQLGFYEYASNIPLMMVNTLSRVLNTVLFSAFSSLQDKHEELTKLLLNVYRYNAMLTYPILVGIGLVAEDFILVAYGERWLPILVPLRLFCAVGLMQIYTQPLYILCNGIGKPNLPFRWSLIFLPINLGLIWAGMKLAGMNGVVAGRLAFPIFMIATLGVQVMKHLKVSWARIFAATLPASAGCVLMAAAIWGLRASALTLPSNDLLRLLLLVGVGAGMYLGFMFVFFRGELLGLVRRLRPGS